MLAYADRTAVVRLCAEHLAGRRDHGGTLWRLMALNLWLEHAGAESRSLRRGGSDADVDIIVARAAATEGAPGL